MVRMGTCTYLYDTKSAGSVPGEIYSKVETGDAEKDANSEKEGRNQSCRDVLEMDKSMIPKKPPCYLPTF